MADEINYLRPRTGDAGEPIDYVRSPYPREPNPSWLPDLDGAIMRQRVNATQTPKDWLLDRHGVLMSKFMEEALGPALMAMRSPKGAMMGRDAVMANRLEKRLDRMENTNSPSWDRGITGGDPRRQRGGVPYNNSSTGIAAKAPSEAMWNAVQPLPYPPRPQQGRNANGSTQSFEAMLEMFRKDNPRAAAEVVKEIRNGFTVIPGGKR